MEEFKYNKNGEIYKCLELDSILNCSLIPDNIKEESKKKFGKDCYFNLNGTTKICKLIGIEINTKLNELYYILEDNKDKYYIFTRDIRLKRL